MSDPMLAYKNGAFLDGPDARPLRILAEYLQPLRELRRAHVHDTVVFFGSARFETDAESPAFAKSRTTRRSP
jgi:hypothetical protein